MKFLIMQFSQDYSHLLPLRSTVGLVFKWFRVRLLP